MTIPTIVVLVVEHHPLSGSLADGMAKNLPCSSMGAPFASGFFMDDIYYFLITVPPHGSNDFIRAGHSMALSGLQIDNSQITGTPDSDTPGIGGERQLKLPLHETAIGFSVRIDFHGAV